MSKISGTTIQSYTLGTNCLEHKKSTKVDYSLSKSIRKSIGSKPGAQEPINRFTNRLNSAQDSVFIKNLHPNRLPNRLAQWKSSFLVVWLIAHESIHVLFYHVLIRRSRTAFYLHFHWQCTVWTFRILKIPLRCMLS